MSSKQTDVRTRIRELEATVRGLTQELVEANERIRSLEASFDEEESRPDEPGVRSESDGESDEEANTKQMERDDEGEAETASDLDDIIVA